MSSYEQYGSTSRHYDLTRRPVGTEIVLGVLAAGDRPLDELEVLDAGCGTGAYLHVVLPAVARVTGLDGSEGMLARAAEKVADELADGRAVLTSGELSALPFDAGSFDAVMINQVLHHLPDDPAAGWPQHRAVLSELRRVLRPGGALVITTCGREQLRQGYWYYELIRSAADALRQRYIPLPVLAEVLRDMGLVDVRRFVPLDALVQGEAYLDALGPLDPRWRDGDSVWALASDDERDAAVARLRELADRDGATRFMQTHDARRPELGQVTVVAARLG